jgi:ParB/RepB/Spo0J family partition protein
MSGAKPSKPSGALARVLQGYDGAEHGAPVAPNASTGAKLPTPAAGPVRVFPIKGHAKVPPEVCAPWRHADRQAWEFDHVDELVESFRTDGQFQPALVFMAPPGSQPEGSPVRYLIVAGVARWEGAKKAGTELDVVIREFADERAAFRAMVRENEYRRPLSDYSKAKRFRRALDAGVYASAAELAADNRISKGEVSKLLRLAELDDEVVNAFSSPGVITTKLGYALAQAIDGGLRRHVLRDAPKIESGEITLAMIPAVWGGKPFPDDTGTAGTALPSPPPGQETKAGTRRFPVTAVNNKDGMRLFSVAHHPSRGVTVRLSPAVEVDESFIKSLTSLARRAIRRKPRPARR